MTFAVCGALFGVFAGAGFYAINLLNRNLISNQEITVESSTEVLADKEVSVPQLTMPTETKVITADVTEVVDEVMPAMVSIVNKYLEKGSFFGQTFTQEAQSSGSGIIIAQDEKELLIATNYHVIADTKHWR